MPQIYDLPLELVSEVASHLDFADVLSLRQSTRILRKATEDPVVWYWLARNYAEQHRNIPRPENGTIETLKANELREWIWPRLVVDQVWRKKSAAPTSRIVGVHKGAKLRLVPGGRWLLAVRYSGRVDFSDLSSREPSIRALSKPSPSDTSRDAPSNFAISINASAPSLEFTLAVSYSGRIGVQTATSPDLYSGGFGDRWFHIRRVNLVGEGPSATLQAEEPISIPPLRTRGDLTAIGLSGELLASNYSFILEKRNCVEVLRWTECSTEELMAAYIQIGDNPVANHIYFISEDHILYVASGPVLVYQIPHLARLSPDSRESAVRHRDPGGQEGDAQPVWTFYREIDLWPRTPAFSPDGAGHRFVIQDGSAIVGIYFPPSLNDQPSVKFRVELGYSDPSMVGLLKGCMMDAYRMITRFGYGWNGGGGEVFDCVSRWRDPEDLPLWRSGMLFDEETGRCIFRRTKRKVSVVDFLPQ